MREGAHRLRQGGHGDFYFGHRPDVSHIADHFRELADFGCLEPVAWRKARGSMATTYVGQRAPSWRTGTTWDELTNGEVTLTGVQMTELGWRFVLACRAPGKVQSPTA